MARLKLIVGTNDLASVRNDLANQWDHDENGELTPRDVTYNSSKKYYWVCAKGHSYKAAVKSRVCGTGCPYCANKKVLAGYNDLATTCPDVVSWWDQEKNGDLTPQSVLPGTHRSVWWVCPEGHSFDMMVQSFRKRISCPICSGKRVSAGINDLATVEPNLAREWHPRLNGDLTPQMVTRCSNKKVWWMCAEGHEWESVINNRSRLGRGCPYCAGYLPITGKTDLATTNPELVDSWSDRNVDVYPTMVTKYSHISVWWKCPEGHEWKTTVASRTSSKGCPYCAGQRVWPGFNDLKTKRPDLAAEWHPTKNGDLTPTGITQRSNKKVWWICPLGHEWQESVNNRWRGSHGCPVCSGHKVLYGFNDLETLSPKMAGEWHPTKNGDLKPRDITARNDRSVWWICERGHEYRAQIGARFRTDSGCPYCANKKALAGFNDLATTDPAVAAQWCYEKNGDVTPQMVVRGSLKKYWWTCSKGHVWESIVLNRVRGSGCPACAASYQTSFPEKAIFHYVSIFGAEENANLDIDGFGRRTVDIWIPSLDTAIEYDGWAWHKDTARDFEKDRLCASAGIRMIRVREEDCPSYETTAEIIIRRHPYTDESLADAIVELFDLIGHECEDGYVDIDRDRFLIQQFKEIPPKALSGKAVNLMLFDPDSNIG